MLGLCKLVHALATHRAGYPPFMWDGTKVGLGPITRKDVLEAEPEGYPASREYYAIIDRITRGEKP